MTEQQILDLGPALADYLDNFLFCCNYTQTFRHLGTYCRGLLSDLKRKTAEPIALAAGVGVRTMQLFLSRHGWNHHNARQLLHQRVAAFVPDLPDEGTGTVGVIDESGHAKKGDMTPGVQRQYCGELGKRENCIVTVHLAVARERYKTLIDADLFLPESWDADRPRCREAGIPDDLHHRPKWRIGLEQFHRAKANGIHFDWLTFDEGYGAAGEFLAGLGEQRYVGEVPCSWWCFARPQDAEHPSRADDLVRYSPLFNQQPWGTIRLQRETLGEQVWHYRAARVWASSGSKPRPEACWLIHLVNEQTGEEKYFVSNASADTSVELLIRVGFRRWTVEHAIRLGKQEIGLKHFEGQDYTALMRHLTLCLLMMGFVAEQAAQLRKKNPEVTAEQVCEGLNAVLGLWLMYMRGSNEVAYKSQVIQYHQQRNRAARESRQRRAAGTPEENQRRRRRRKRRHCRTRRRCGAASNSS
jgi:SRSO17 transposase